MGEDEATHISVNILYTEASLCLQTIEVDVAHLMRRMSQMPNPPKSLLLLVQGVETGMAGLPRVPARTEHT
jgi:hypothetical protein